MAKTRRWFVNTVIIGLRSDSAVATGFDGYRLLARALPLGWPVLPVLYIPGVPLVGRRIYVAVAARRARTCAVPAAAQALR